MTSKQLAIISYLNNQKLKGAILIGVCRLEQIHNCLKLSLPTGVSGIEKYQNAKENRNGNPMHKASTMSSIVLSTIEQKELVTGKVGKKESLHEWKKSLKLGFTIAKIRNVKTDQ